jgi:hypothetical protein
VTRAFVSQAWKESGTHMTSLKYQVSSRSSVYCSYQCSADRAFCSGAGDENRTRMASLERICAPTRGDSDAPAGLTCMHREAPSSTLAWGPRRARRAAAVRFAVFLLPVSGSAMQQRRTEGAVRKSLAMSSTLPRTVRPGSPRLWRRAGSHCPPLASGRLSPSRTICQREPSPCS